MTTIRTSATVLEQFRRYLETDYVTEADLEATIRGEFTPTAAMLVGRAYHKVLETPERYREQGRYGYLCDGYSFDNATMDPMLALIDRRGVSEVKGTIDLDGCTLVAQADHLLGTEIHEYKTTDYFNAEKYVESIQWRIMALVFRPAVIHYHIAALDDHGNSVVNLKGPIDSLSVYPYPALEDECRALVQAFVRYVTLRGLDGYLRERQLLAMAPQ